MGELTKTGTYIATYLANEEVLERKVHLSGAGFRLSRSLHCTLIYSENLIEGVQTIKGGVNYPTRIIDLNWWEGHDKMGYLVALLDPEKFAPRHQQLLDMGGQCSYPEYRPHMTLTWGLFTETGRVPMSREHGEFWVERLRPHLIDLPLVFLGERVEPLRF